MKRYNYFADEEQLAALKRLQERTGVPVSESHRRAIEMYLKSLPPEPHPAQLELPLGDG